MARSEEATPPVENLLPWLSVFGAGVAAGAALPLIVFFLSSRKKKRTELLNARARILAGIKDNHEKEIMREIFRATDALHGEIGESMRLITKSVEKFLSEIKNQRQNGAADNAGQRRVNQSTPSA